MWVIGVVPGKTGDDCWLQVITRRPARCPSLPAPTFLSQACFRGATATARVVVQRTGEFAGARLRDRGRPSDQANLSPLALPPPHKETVSRCRELQYIPQSILTRVAKCDLRLVAAVVGFAEQLAICFVARP